MTMNLVPLQSLAIGSVFREATSLLGSDLDWHL